MNGQKSYFHQLNTRRRGVEPEVRSSLSAPQRQTGERSTFRGRTNNGGQLQQHWHWRSGTSALALALKGEVPKCLPCALPGSTRLHSATRTSCETAGTGRIPNLIHQMEFLPPKSHTVLLGLTATHKGGNAAMHTHVSAVNFSATNCTTRPTRERRGPHTSFAEEWWQ